MTLESIYRSLVTPWSDIQTQMPILRRITSGYPRVKVLELGVRSGNSTAAFMVAAEETDGHVWSVDIDPPPACPEWEKSGRWTFLQGNDLDLAIDVRPDVLFIDTSHEFDHTVAELRKFIPMVAPGGVALFHDTLLTWDHAIYQVPQALDVYCAETGLTWTELSEPPYGLGQILHPNG